jgi:hypothetical protein
MKSIARTAASLAALMLLATACSDSPVAPEAAPRAATTALRPFANGAQSEVRISTYDYEGSLVSYTCEGEEEGAHELVQLAGQVIEKETWSLLPTGALHLRLTSMGSGLRGVGTETGDEYRYVDDEKIVYNATPMATTSRFASTARLINQRTKQGLTLIQHAWFVVNANGELVIERSGQTVKCD